VFLLGFQILHIKIGIRQPCFSNHFAATNVTGFSETLSLAENSLSLARKYLSFAEKFLNLGGNGMILYSKNGILLTKIVVRADLATFRAYHG